MSDNVNKQTKEYDYVTPRHRLDSGDRPPTTADVENMFRFCKEMKGTDIEWAWKAGSRNRVFTLKAQFPRMKDRDFWDYEMRDDPVWTLIDNREHGNNLIWQQKTSDCDLVLAIVETQGQRTETQEFTVDLQHVMPLLTPIQPVFVELLAVDQAINQGFQPIHNSISGLAYNYFTGLLEISTFHQNGKIWFENGALVHATTPRSVGDMAVIEMVTWNLGNTSYINGELADARTISRPLDFLIHEGIALLEEKRYLASSGLAYESWLIRSGRESTMNAQGEDVQLKQAILSYLRRPTTLLDLLRDLELTEWQWIPALYHLLNQNLVGINPPMHERSMALKLLRLNKSGIDERAGHFLSPKTGLYRYETLMLLLAREFRRFQLHGSPLALVCLEIKTKEGGKVKPQWLTPEAVQIVQQRVDFLKRPTDLFTHFEIMDYALLMPDTTVQKAAVVASNIHAALSNIVIDADGTELTISCGVAGLPEHGNDLGSLVKTAKGAMHQAKVLMVPIMSGLLPDVPTGVPDKQTSSYTPTGEIQTETISLENLLVKSEVISKEHLENALALVKQMHTPLTRVLTMYGINVPERVVQAAEEIQGLVEKREIAPEDAIKALNLIDNSELSVDAAFRRLRIIKRQTKPNLLAEILLQAGIVNERDMKQRSRESLSTGLPLGYLLAHQELISRALLHDTLDAIRLLRKGVLSRQEVYQVLHTVRQGQGSLRDICAAQNLPTAAIESVGTGELVVLAGIMSEVDLVTAREYALMEERDIDEILVENGFATEECVEAVKELRCKIEKENLDPQLAAELLKKKLAKGAAPDAVTIAPAPQEGLPASNDVRTPARNDVSIPARNDVSLTAQNASATESVSKPPHQPASHKPPPRDRIQIKRAGETTLPLHQQFSSKPSLQPPPPPEPPKEVDRVDLLKFAGLINDQQADGARKLSIATNTPPLRILFDRGMIDQQTLNLAGIAKRKIDAGEIDTQRAITIIKYCKSKNVDFDEGQSALPIKF